VAKLTSYNNFT